MEAINVFFTQNRALIYFIGGLSFFSMGLATVLQRRRSSRLRLARWLGLLAWFGILYGINEWLNLVIPLQDVLPVPASAGRLAVLQVLTRGLALTLLFQFGVELLRPPLGRWKLLRFLPAAFVIAWLAALTYVWLVLGAPGEALFSTGDVLARYLLGMPAAALSCLGLVEQRREVVQAGFPGIARYLLGAAVSLGFFGLVGALFAVAGPFFPGEWLGYPAILYAIGVFVPILRALDGVAMAFFTGRALEVFEVETEALMAEIERKNLLLADRERISRELHDGIIQSLYAAGLRLEDAYHTTRESPDGAERKIRAVMASLNQVIQEIRAYIFDLQEIKEEGSLIQRLADLVREVRLNTMLEVDFRVHGERCAVLPECAAQLSLIAQEALSNVVRHAGARRVKVDLTFGAELLSLRIEDDGCGFEQQDVLLRRQGMGLRTMAERTALLGGAFSIETQIDGGARLTVEVPCSEREGTVVEAVADGSEALAYPPRG